jgi:hypothetical protein
MKTLTTTRYIPTSSSPTEFPDVHAVVHITEHDNGHFTAIAYSGERNNHDWNFRFKTRYALDLHVNNWVECLRSRASIMAKRAEERRSRVAAGHTVKVGDVFHYSWGYDQTNVEYLQVIAVTKATVTVREFGQVEVRQTGWASATVKAKPGSFLDDSKPIVKHVKTFETGEHYLSFDFGIVTLDRGGDSYSSWYA